MFDSIGSMHDSIFVNTTNITNNTENITTITNNVNNITTDIHALDSVISARIIRDSTELSNRMDTLLTYVCDSVETCVKGWISDSTRMIVDSLGAYYDTTLMKKAIHDTADVLRSMMTDAANDAKITIQKNGGDVGHFTLNQATDQAINILVPTTVAEMTDASNYVTHTQLNDTLGAYYDTTAVRTVIHDSLGNYQIKDCADVTNCVNTALADGTSATNRAIDSIAANVIHDSIVSNIQPSITETIHDSIVSNIQTNINTTIHDSIVNNIQTNINTTIHDSIVNNISGQIRDTVRNAIHDSLGNYLTINGLCDSVMKCDGIKTMRDSIQKVNAHVSADSLVLATKIHEDSLALATKIHADSVNLAKHISDSTQMVFDTLHRYYATKDTLKNFLTINGLCDSVMKCDGIKTMRDSIQKVDARLTIDSTVLADKIRSDSSTVHGALVDSLKHYLDSTQVVRSIHDSIGNGTLTIAYGTVDSVKFTANQKTNGRITIPAQVNADWNAIEGLAKIENKPTIPAVNNSTVTVNMNGTPAGSFTLNQSDPAVVNLNYVAVTNEGTTNTYVNTNDFTGGTITVPSKFDIQNPPTSSTCTQDAVNICDLLSVFDSLNRRLAAVEAELASLKTGLPVFVSLTFSEITFNSMKATAEFTNSGAPISFYRFCISKNEDMSDPIGCYITTDPEYTFVNLDPKTLYYVSVTATNAAGTSEPGKNSARTLANITIALNGPDSVTYACGTTDPEPHYTITVKDEGEDITSQCSFVWKVNNVKVDSSTNSSFDTSYFKEVQATIEESMIVTCTVILTADTLKRTDTVTTIVTNNPYSLPVISICISDLIITDRGSQNIVAVKWESADENFTSATALNHTYHETGSHTITVKSATGCETDTTITFVPLTPCAVGNHPAQTSTVLANAGVANSTNGLEITDGGAVTKVKDVDGNEYAVVQIGSLCWMAENLRTTQYGDGTEITVGTTASDVIPYIYYPSGDAANLNEYGYLYNWQAATKGKTVGLGKVQGACPAGWHVPSELDWQTLDLAMNGSALDFNQSQTNSGGDFTGRLAKGCGWNESNAEAAPGNYAYDRRNESGFGALPAGWRTDSQFTGFGMSAAFWTSTIYESGGIKIYTRLLQHDTSAISRSSGDIPVRYYAYAVRCVRDTAYDPVELTFTNYQKDINICSNGSGDVTYTAKVTRYNKDVTSEYTYDWSVLPLQGGGMFSQDSNTVTYMSAGGYKVFCTVKQGTDVVAKDSVTTTVSVLQAPVFTTCEEGYDETNQGYLVKLMSLNQDATFNWGDTSSSTNVDVDTITDNGQKFVINGTITHIYRAQGTPTITATSNSNGCAATKQIALGNTTVHACSSSLFTKHQKQSNEEVNTDGNLISVRDYDGNEYPVVQIGNLCWLAENLRTTHYSNGDTIANGIGHNGSLTKGYYYPANPGNPQETYGNYYNWYATTRGIPCSEANPIIPGVCPTGWHVPRYSDWVYLLTTAQASDSAVKLAKSCDWVAGNLPNLPGDYNSLERNEYGFGALPADWYVFNDDLHYYNGGQYDNGKSRACFWSSEVASIHNAYYLILTSNDPNIKMGGGYDYDNRVKGLSVRCVRDTTNAIPNPILMGITRSGSSRMCDGNAAVITYTAVVNQNGTDIADQFTYEWKRKLNGTWVVVDGVSTKSYTATYNATGFYEVSCKATNSSVGTLEQAISHSVESGTTPGDFTISKVGNNVTVTLGTPKPDMVYWGDNSEGVQTTSNSITQVSHNYNENGEYFITAFNGYVDGIGNDNSCKLIKPVTIAAPIASITPADSAVSFCVGKSDTVEFTAQITEAGIDVTSSYNIQWSVKNPLNQTTSNAGTGSSFTYNNFNNVGTYTVSYTATQGSVQLTKTATVTANTKTTPAFGNYYVEGRRLTVNASGADKIYWSANDLTGESFSNEGQHLYAVNGDSTVTIKNTMTGCTANANVKVDVSLGITPVGNTGICENGDTTVTYTATLTDNGQPAPTSPSATYTYVWNVLPPQGGGMFTQESNQVTYSSTGTFTVNCTAQNNELGNVSASTTTEVTAFPAFDFNISGASTGTVTLTGNNISEVDWGDGTTNNQTSHEYIASGSYNITASDANGCSKTADNVAVTVSSFVCGTSTVTDIDGNVYNTVQIGTGENAQCWMKENLKVKTGLEPGPTVNKDDVNVSHKYYYYPNFDPSKESDLGLLYNWTAAMNNSTSAGSQGICPSGWHIPTQEEWLVMFEIAIGEDITFANLPTSSSWATKYSDKQIAGLFTAVSNNTSSWNWQSSTSSDCYPGNSGRVNPNSTGFSALPAGGYTGGYLRSGGSATGNPVIKFNTHAFFWSSTSWPENDYAYQFGFTYNNCSACQWARGWSEKKYFASVRCIRN
jgi:uncharacterized protein (TIGR02145 family)